MLLFDSLSAMALLLTAAILFTILKLGCIPDSFYL